MNKKIIIIILSVLFIISSCLSLIGFIHHKKNQNQSNKLPSKDKITYEYYLEDELQKSIPSNEKDEDDWKTEFERMLNNIGDDARVKLVDCHI